MTTNAQVVLSAVMRGRRPLGPGAPPAEGQTRGRPARGCPIVAVALPGLVGFEKIRPVGSSGASNHRAD